MSFFLTFRLAGCWLSTSSIFLAVHPFPFPFLAFPSVAPLVPSSPHRRLCFFSKTATPPRLSFRAQLFDHPVTKPWSTYCPFRIHHLILFCLYSADHLRCILLPPSPFSVHPPPSVILLMHFIFLTTIQI